MVSENITDKPVISDRGIIAEESIHVIAPPRLAESPLPSFWGSVIAGTVAVLAISALSASLMFGCHVGVYSSGYISFGGGAAIWAFVTAIIAYYCGGAIASRLSLSGGMLRGVVVWALSLPLGVLLAAFVLGYAGMHAQQLTEQLNGSGTAMFREGNAYVSFAGAWITFVCEALGLIFCAIGSVSVRGADEV